MLILHEAIKELGCYRIKIVDEDERTIVEEYVPLNQEIINERIAKLKKSWNISKVKKLD